MDWNSLAGKAAFIYTDEKPDVGLYTTIGSWEPERFGLMTRYGTFVPAESIIRIEEVIITDLRTHTFVEPPPVLYERPADLPAPHPSGRTVSHHEQHRTL